MSSGRTPAAIAPILGRSRVAALGARPCDPSIPTDGSARHRGRGPVATDFHPCDQYARFALPDRHGRSRSDQPPPRSIARSQAPAWKRQALATRPADNAFRFGRFPKATRSDANLQAINPRAAGPARSAAASQKNMRALRDSSAGAANAPLGLRCRRTCRS